MSYDLLFWKQADDSTILPEDAYELLSERQSFSGHEDMESGRFLSALQSSFPAIASGYSGDCVMGDGGMFVFEISAQLAHFTAKKVDGNNLNKIIDAAFLAGGILYDPQTNQRYDGVEREKKKKPHHDSAPMTPANLKEGWIKCPGCGFKLQWSNLAVWQGNRHKRCGQRIVRGDA